jgi:hypothetical protein
MAMSFGAPGANLSVNNRFMQLLQSAPSSNNGTAAGGIGSVLQKALMGYMMGKDSEDQTAARGVMSQALQAMQGTPEQTIQFTTPRPDGTGDMTQTVPAVAPNRNLAAQLLASNPQTAPMGFQLAMGDADRAAKLQDAIALKQTTGAPTDPNTVKEYQFAKNGGYTGSFEDFLKIKSSSEARLPAAPIQNFARREQLVQQYGPNSPQVQVFDNYVRSIPYLNTGPAFVKPDIANAGGVAGTIANGLKPGEEPSVKGAQAQAAAAGKAAGTTQGTAEATMPSATQSKDYLLGLIDAVSNNKDLDKATGFYSYLPTIPGFNSDVRSRIDQLQGQNFLQAYQGLRGGGQITEVEGKKAQDAQARLNTAQTPQEFRAALKDMADLVNQRFAVQKQQAGVTGAPQAASAAQGVPPLPPGFVPVQ